MSSSTTASKGALWQYFRSFATGVGVYRLTPGIMQELRGLLHKHEPDMRAVAQAAKEDLEASEHREGLPGRVDLARSAGSSEDEDEDEEWEEDED